MSNANEMLIKHQVAITNLTSSTTEKTAWVSKMQQIEKDIEHWNQAKTLLELLKNHKLEKRKDFILNVINSAMRDIFQQDYRLDILPKETRGKSAGSTQKYDIIFYQNGIEIAKNDDLLSSNGGGVLSIASLFFKILIGYLYSGNKFYIFDESLSQVSPQYRMRLSTFLREFCDKYGFTLVVVSQTEELEVDAHLVYEVDAEIDSKGVPVLKIVHQEGEIPKDGFFYSHIENFQSIKKQDFIYKGFTVIRGPNNSGKSATLRSIEAIIFNNFQVDNYPRLNPDGKALTTEIRFGYVPTVEEQNEGKEQKEIGLIYKSKKVLFIINGKEYFGKSLASDKLKAAVEEIGFKYIDVKKLYKNFKGALKEQTERIAYTSQYDGLFLIGSKTTDSEKIFSFLFNTENIALAVAQAKDTMLEMNRSYKEAAQRVIEIDEKIQKLNYEIDYYNKKYYMYLIREKIELDEKIESVLKIKTKMDSEITLIGKFTDLVLDLQQIDIINSSININQNALIDINSKYENYNLILVAIQNIQAIDYWIETNKTMDFYKNSIQINALKINLAYWSAFIKLNSDTQILKNKLIYYTELLSIIQASLDIWWYFYTIDAINYYKNELEKNHNQIHNLGLEYNLEICPSCSGCGVTPK